MSQSRQLLNRLGSLSDISFRGITLKKAATVGLLFACAQLYLPPDSNAQDLSGIERLKAKETAGPLKDETLKLKRDFIPRHTAGIILPYKADKLNGRQPLLLVHGIGGTEGSNLSEWDNFLEFTDKHPEFQKRFKVYMFHYDSMQSVEKLSTILQQQLRILLKEPGKGINLSSTRQADQVNLKNKIKIVAYSEGGLLTRNALQDSTINQQVEQVITIATPFHGSPMASREWFCDQLVQGSVFDPIRVSRKIAYWVAQKKHPNFETDFRWDNVDGIIPQKLPEKLPLEKLSLKDELIDKIAAAPPKNPPINYALESKINFITYGSFFGTPNTTDQQMVNSLSLKIPMPVEKIKLHTGKAFMFNLVNHTFSNIGKLASKSIALAQTAQPGQPTEKTPKNQLEAAAEIADSHTLLAVANEAIQGEVAQDKSPGASDKRGTPDKTGTSQSVLAKKTSKYTLSTISMMPFNDGISPISSSLWLGRFTPGFKESEQNPSKRLWAALRSLKGTEKARLFAGMDHKNWIEGENRTLSNAIPDLLNPQDAPKTVFDWLVSDLMQESQQKSSSN